ncbi:MAG: class I SAM-dependent methyltransferase [Halobacteriales archaeon]
MAEMNPVARLWVNTVNQHYVPRIWRRLLDSVDLDGVDWLEVGAGKGYVTELALERHALRRAVVTDYDEHQVESAREYLDVADGDVSVEVADVLDLDYPDGSFDAVAASLVLHLLEPRWTGTYERVPLAIKEIDRVLRDDGLLLALNFTRNTRVRRSLRNLGYDVEYQRRHLPGLESYVYRRR